MLRILAFGEVMMRMMPPNYKTLMQSENLEFIFTGTGVNILSGLYQMGDTGYLLTCLPDNSVGKAASAHIRKIGIHDDYISFKRQHIGIYFLEQGIGNRASQVTYLNRKDSSFGLSQLSDYDLTCLDKIDVLHICGISLALNKSLQDTTFALVQEAKKRKKKIVFDCNFRASLWVGVDKEEIKTVYERMLNLADIVFAGIKDATLLLNKQVDPSLEEDLQLENVLKQMCHDYHIEAIFGTIRQNENNRQYLSGYLVQENAFYKSRRYELTIFDRIGGGDGFAAGAIHGYFNEMDVKTLVEYATCSGVLAHTTYGDSPILDKDSILDFMKNGTSDIKR